MKFYEYDSGFKYYAIISANSEEEATDAYFEEGGLAEHTSAKPTEMTVREVVTMFLEVYAGELDEFAEDCQALFDSTKPVFLTMDIDFGNPGYCKKYQNKKREQ